MTTNNEVDALNAEPEFIELEDGTRITVQRLRTRQMFRLLKILTHGAGGALASLNFTDNEAFIGELLALTIASIPNAEDETIEFVLSMVDSADVIEKPRTKGDRERNEELRNGLAEKLINPSLDDLITIIEVIIRKEAPEMVALGKRLGALLQTTVAQQEVAPEPEKAPAKQKRS